MSGVRKRWLVISGMLALLPAFAGSASADDQDEVAKRLDKHGKLSSSEARKLVSSVSSRMKRAADMTSTNDPLRMAVSNALYGTPAPADAMGAAKVRLRLYAGLNEWALDNLFAPRPGALSTCTGQFGLRGRDCEALLAAAGRMTTAEAAKAGGGAAVAASAAAQRPAYGQPAANSRFTGYNSANRPAGWGAQPGYAAAPRYGAQQQQAGWGKPAQPAAQQPGWGNAAQQQRPAYGNYAARPAAPAAAGWGQRPAAAPVARPMPMAVAPAPTAVSVAQRKAEYERKRQEYLDRKKAEMEARKTKVVATAGGTERVQRGPGSEEEAEAAGLDPSQVAKAKPTVAAKAPGAPAAEEAAPAEAETAKNEKPQLDSSFLDGLMDDPLGKSK